MQIGNIGSGDVGRALAAGFLQRGDAVKIGTRDPSTGALDGWLAERGKGATVGTFAEVAEFGDVVLVATLWSGTPAAIALAGPERMRGKTVIDVTNPLVFRDDGPPALAVGHTDSGGEAVQRLLPDAHVVKAFNVVGNALFYKPDLPGGPPTMFYCGNDASAKAVVARILADFGWEAFDIGGIEGARLLEPICILWVEYGIRSGTWVHAVKMLRKDGSD